VNVRCQGPITAGDAATRRLGGTARAVRTWYTMSTPARLPIAKGGCMTLAPLAATARPHRLNPTTVFRDLLR
jgi:hypothetical protein